MRGGFDVDLVYTGEISSSRVLKPGFVPVPLAEKGGSDSIRWWPSRTRSCVTRFFVADWLALFLFFFIPCLLYFPTRRVTAVRSFVVLPGIVFQRLGIVFHCLGIVFHRLGIVFHRLGTV